MLDANAHYIVVGENGAGESTTSGVIVADDRVSDSICDTGHAGDQRGMPEARVSAPTSAVFADRGGAPYRVAVTVCKECKRGWQHGSGAVVEMSPAAVDRAQCDAQWIGDLSSDTVERARQEISMATRRKVLHRDQNRCRVPGCQCHSNLDIHHITHRADGGTHDLNNLITLCEAHHLAHHDGTLAIVREHGDVKFRFEGRNRFTRKAREIATRESLRKRGIDRERVKQVMARTVNEIGETALTEDQWLAIALRYAEASHS